MDARTSVRRGYIYRCIRPVWTDRSSGTEGDGNLKKTLQQKKIFQKKYYYAVFGAEVAGMPCIVSKTGYTGEDGVEIYLASENAEKMWETLLEAGKEEGLIPCGLGARDTLRMEAAMPLYGHEMDDEVSPLETGLNFGVKMKKDEFIGKKAIEDRGTPKIEKNWS